MHNFDFCLILTATINPGNMPDLVRNDAETRLEDYKKSFDYWVNHKNVNKIIFIENSNYELKYFKNKAAENKSKKIEIISSNLNSIYDKKLGKGYGQYLCLKHVFEESILAKDVNYFIDVTGRHIITNFDKIFNHIKKDNSDIYINLSDSLKFSDTNIYGGTKNFFLHYLLPETSKTNDSLGNIFEKCVAKAVLKGVSNDLKLSDIPIYPQIDGFIGTNGKKYKQNFIKKTKLFFFRKLKQYFFAHKKY